MPTPSNGNWSVPPHATPAERERVAQLHRQRRDAVVRRNAQLVQTVKIVALGILSLLVAAIAWNIWHAWQHNAIEAACKAPRSQRAAAVKEADLEKIPVIGDPISSPRPRNEYIPESNATDRWILIAYNQRRRYLGEASEVVLHHQSCFDWADRSQAQQVLATPETVAWVDMPSGAECADGWSSSSIGKQGACSHHGGVVYDLYAVLHF
ncbi:hypothetical protein [Streptomyces sp. YS-3]|uniref:hypothetical protein n=1 Tax=Streptomyces sp. YS-3 TaxID=3381352 RepID=UPI00386287D0